MIYLSPVYQAQLDRNLNDWAAGGPSEYGWTRSGPSFIVPKLVITNHRLEDIKTDEVLAKNMTEVMRWHVAFLENHTNPKDTAYFKEYLMPRHRNEKLAMKRALEFIELFHDISENGLNRPVMVAEAATLGMKYFRFDGCHRASSML